MTIEPFVGRLSCVRPSGHGYVGCCPAHDDRHPSLNIREADDGRILVHCFAGCSIEAICAALGIVVGDLFPDDSRLRGKGKDNRRTPTPWCLDRWRTAFAFHFYADGLWLRAKSVLGLAKGLDTTKWTEEDTDTAIKAVGRAYADLERSDRLEDIAFHWRVQGLKKRRNQDATRSRVT